MVILLLVSLSYLSPQPADTIGRVTFIHHDISLREVLVEIEKQTDFKFFYSNNEIDTERRVAVNFADTPIATALDFLFRDTPVNYRFSGNYIILIREKRHGVATQSGEHVMGRVTAENGDPIPGVNVIEKGTASGSVTDANGYYRLAISDSTAKLVFSFIGFQSKEIHLDGRTSYDVTMAQEIKTLSEVVVIGYGTQKRSEVTGSIASVTKGDLNQLPVSNVEQGLQGRIPGVTVTQSASPGGNVSVRIRGIGTIGYNEPLFIVDGVQTTNALDNINPGDIESIDVLKDASAAAIYGSQAANGIVTLITNRGKRNSQTKVDVSVYTGFQQLARKIDVTNAQEYVHVITEARRNANLQLDETNAAPHEPLPAEFHIDSVSSLTDWQDEIFHTGIIQNYQIGLSGGNNRTNYAMSASYRNEQGIILNSAFNRWTFRTNIDHDVLPFLKVGSTINVAYRDRKEIIDNDIWNGVIQSAISMPEMFAVKDENGNYVGTPGGSASVYGNAQNPVGQAERADTKHPAVTLMGNIYGEVSFLKDFKLKSLLSTDLSHASFKYYQPTFPEGSRPTKVATLYQSATQRIWWNWENTLTFSKDFSQHEVVGMVGMSAQGIDLEYFDASSEGFPAGDPVATRFLSYGKPVASGGGATSSALLSFFGRATYNFADRYLLTATVRHDGSSRFYRDKWGTFPSASIGWRLCEERFLKDAQFLSELKVRASWGMVGNQAVNSDYPWVTTIGPGVNYNTAFGGKLQYGVALNSRGNRSLTWETTTMTNVGLDAGVLSDRVQVSVDYFFKRTSDMLLQIPISLIAGQATPPSVNAGSVENKGLEVVTTYSDRVGNLNFSLSGNASFIKNVVTDLATVEYILANNTLRGSEDISRVTVGSAIGSYFGYVTDGIFQNQNEIDQHARQEPGTRPGDIRFKDISGPNGVPDGVIDASDRTILGDGFPDLTFGLNLTLRYSRLEFSAFLQGVSGVEIFNALEYLTLNNQGGNKSAAILNYWRENNTDTDMPRLNWDDPNRNSRISDRYLHDGSYLRMKNVMFSYNFKLQSLKSTRADRNLRLYLSLQNLFTMTKYTGLDPEVGSAVRGYGADINLGVDQGRYPQPRTYTIGFNLSF